MTTTRRPVLVLELTAEMRLWVVGGCQCPFLVQLESHRELLMCQAQMTVSDALEDFVQTDVKTVKVRAQRPHHHHF